MNIQETRELGTAAVAVVDGTPVGPLALIATSRGLREVRFGVEDAARDARILGEEEAEEMEPEEALQARRQARDHLDQALAELRHYFEEDGDDFRVDLDLAEVATEFQETVLRELRNVPRGAVVTYGELAEMAGSPNAARGAGQAVGSNPIPVVIPCHRVVRSDHSLGDYGGGTPRKMTLLHHEGVGVTGSRKKDKVRAATKV